MLTFAMTRRRLPSPDRLLRNLRKAFIKRFGREPGPDDPLFFDPDVPGDVPVQITEYEVRDQTLAAMTKAGIPGEIAYAYAYAYAKTGLMVVESFVDRFKPEDLAEWQAAIEEYRRQERQPKN